MLIKIATSKDLFYWNWNKKTKDNSFVFKTNSDFQRPKEGSMSRNNAASL